MFKLQNMSPGIDFFSEKSKKVQQKKKFCNKFFKTILFYPNNSLVVKNILVDDAVFKKIQNELMINKTIIS